MRQIEKWIKSMKEPKIFEDVKAMYGDDVHSFKNLIKGVEGTYIDDSGALVIDISENLRQSIYYKVAKKRQEEGLKTTLVCSLEPLSFNVK